MLRISPRYRPVYFFPCGWFEEVALLVLGWLFGRVLGANGSTSFRCASTGARISHASGFPGPEAGTLVTETLGHFDFQVCQWSFPILWISVVYR